MTNRPTGDKMRIYDTGSLWLTDVCETDVQASQHFFNIIFGVGVGAFFFLFFFFFFFLFEAT